MTGNPSMVEKYCDMTRSLCLQKPFDKREVAPRFAGILLIVIEIAELAINILKVPFEACALLGILAGKKFFCSNPGITWEKHWQPLETLKKIGLLIVCIFSTIAFGWSFPKFNHMVHERIGLLSPLEAANPVNP